MTKKKTTTRYTQDTQIKHVPLNKVILLVLGSIIATAISTAIGLISVANTDHFTIVANTKRLDDIEGDYVPRAEIEQRLTSLEVAVRTNNQLIIDVLKLH